MVRKVPPKLEEKPQSIDEYPYILSVSDYITFVGFGYF